MRGRKISDGKLFYQARLDDFVPDNQVVKRFNDILDLGYLYEVT
jgi:hypothetical protein